VTVNLPVPDTIGLNMKSDLRLGYKICTLLLVIFWVTAPNASEKPHIYATGNILEPDRIASAWLIKRYIDPKAIFKFYPEGEFIKDGIAYDTPDSKFFRTHNLSTFEVIQKKYKIQDEKVQKIAKIIHDIEINFWGQKKSEIALKVKTEINNIFKNSKSNLKCIENSFRYLDQLVGD